MMRTRSKFILATLIATLLLGLAVSSASAGRFSTSNTRFRFTWSALGIGEPLGANITLTCRVTLEGSFHSATIRKVPRALIGAITRGIVDSSNCRGNQEPTRLTILQESLPWHVTYESFRGTLPNITEISLLMQRYELQLSATVLFVTGFCLYLDGGAPEEALTLAIVRNGSGQLVEASFPSGRRGRFLRGSPVPEMCPAQISLNGRGETFLLGNTSRILVTLI